MMPRARLKLKGRSDRGSFVALPHEILNHPNFTRLTGHGVKLLLDLCSQYKGNNNGDFSAAFDSRMSKRGWRSRGTLARALRELIDTGWIIVTRHGGFNKKCSLYGVTFRPINECGGKLDVPYTQTPPNYWRQINSCVLHKDLSGTTTVLMEPENAPN